MKLLALGIALLAGCSSHTAWKVSAGTPHPDAPVQVHVHSGGDVAALFGLGLFVGSFYAATRGDLGYTEGSSRLAPEMAPDRRVSEQDCTRPLDYTLGNIRCK